MYILNIIRTELINRYHDNLLAAQFDIKKTEEFIAWKYYWSTFYHDIKYYVKKCDIYLALKIIWYKLYSNLQFLPVSTHYWKNLLIDFIMSLPILTEWKRNIYDSIFAIINWLTKMVYYKLIKVIMEALGFIKVSINIMIRYHSLSNLIITD